jgi:hypothetical protein
VSIWPALAPSVIVTLTTPTPAEARVAAKAASYDAELVPTTLAALRRRQATSGKTCRTCDEFKRLSAFGADSRRSDGLKYTCRECLALASRAARNGRVV